MKWRELEKAVSDLPDEVLDQEVTGQLGNGPPPTPSGQLVNVTGLGGVAGGKPYLLLALATSSGSSTTPTEPRRPARYNQQKPA